jgi:heme A synthase
MRFRRYAWLTLWLNLAVILWGAFVRATGSGAGCGRHWPLCNGQILPRAPETNTLIEFAHRASSGLALVLVIGLFVWSRRAFSGGHRVRSAAAWSLGFIVVEALVGAGLVLFELVAGNDSMARAGYLAVHLLNTFLLLAALSLTAFWSGEPASRGLGWRGSSPWLIGAALLAVLVVGMTGAIAALGDTLFPSGSLAEGLRADSSPTAHLLVRLRVLHPLFAILTGLYLSIMVWLVGRERPAMLGSGWARLVPMVVLLQFAVGLTNLLLLAPVLLQLVHLLVADLLWITLILFAATALEASAVAKSPAPVSGAQPLK